MAPFPRLDANVNSTPLQFPCVSPDQTRTAINGNNKRTLPISDEGENNNDDYSLKNGQRPLPSDRGFAVQPQLKHNQDGQQQQQEQPVHLCYPTLAQEDTAQYDCLLPISSLLEYSPYVYQQQQNIEHPYHHTTQFPPVTGSHTDEAIVYHRSPPIPTSSPELAHPTLAFQPFIHEPPPQPDFRGSAVRPPPPQPLHEPKAVTYYASSSARRIMSTTAAAAALSKSSTSSSSGYTLLQPPTAGSSSNNNSRDRHPVATSWHDTKLVDGVTLGGAGVTMPAKLEFKEVKRRLDLINRECFYEAKHPPVLPLSKVPDLPDKPPALDVPKVPDGLSPAAKAAADAEVRRLCMVNKRAYQERNNMAAKKSRQLRAEALNDTKLQLLAKTAECFWLRLHIIAQTGGTGLGGRLPSAAWGGSGYVFNEGAVGAGAGAGASDRDDGAGIVPLSVKIALTNEIHKRVKDHEQEIENKRKECESGKRTARIQKKRRVSEEVRERERTG